MLVYQRVLSGMSHQVSTSGRFHWIFQRSCDGRGDRFRGDTLDAGERGDAARGDAAGDGLPRRRSSGSVPSRGNLNGIEETNEKMGAWSDKHCEIWMKTLFWRNKWRFHMTWKAFGVQEFLPFCRCCKLTFVWKRDSNQPQTKKRCPKSHQLKV